MKDEGEGVGGGSERLRLQCKSDPCEERGRRKEGREGESLTAAVTGKFWSGQRGVPEPVSCWKSPPSGRNGPALALLLGSAIS